MIARSKHSFIHEPVTVIGNILVQGWDAPKGSYQVTAKHWQSKSVGVCVCSRCGTRVFTNTPTMARAVCNKLEINCDTVVVSRVLDE